MKPWSLVDVVLNVWLLLALLGAVYFSVRQAERRALEAFKVKRDLIKKGKQ